jgi:hypothetical protein
VANAIHLCERSFSKEPLDLIRVSDRLAFIQKWQVLNLHLDFNF